RGSPNRGLGGAEPRSRQRRSRIDEIRVRKGAVDAAKRHRPAPQSRARSRANRKRRVRRVRVLRPGHSHGPTRRPSVRHVLRELRLASMSEAGRRHRLTVRNGYAIAVGIAAAVVLLDALTKRWASATFTSEPVDVIGSFLQFRFVENTGAAFSMFQGAGSVFGVAAIVAIALILWFLRKQIGSAHV